MTDVHQSTEAQKENPPSRAHPQHHQRLRPWLEMKDLRFNPGDELEEPPPLGASGAAAGRLGSAGPLVGGHRAAAEPEHRARLSAQRPRGWTARRRREREKEKERERERERETEREGAGTPP